MPRSFKYRLITRLEWVSNRLTRWALRRGLAPKAFALLETVGRRSGLPRSTPIGNGLVGPDTFWLVAAHGWQSARRRPDRPVADAAVPLGRDDRADDGVPAADRPDRPGSRLVATLAEPPQPAFD
jgi:hypothetical protein